MPVKEKRKNGTLDCRGRIEGRQKGYVKGEMRECRRRMKGRKHDL